MNDIRFDTDRFTQAVAALVARSFLLPIQADVRKRF